MMDLDVLITGGVGVVTTFLSGLTSYVFTKKKYNAEVDGTEINNMKESLEFYIKVSDDTKSRLDEYINANSKLEADNAELKLQNSELKIQNEQLIAQNTELLEKINTLEEKIESFSSELNKLSKSHKNGAKSKKNSKEK